jgi:steroid delta-isomerase-like uncharacterized protein
MNESERIARRWFEEVWNRRNANAIGELMAERCVGRSVVGDTTSANAWKEACFTPMSSAIPDLHVTIDGVTAANDEAVVRWQAKGTHRGDGLGVPPTGKTIHVHGLTWMRIRDGQIVEGTDGWDYGSLLMQLGAKP